MEFICPICNGLYEYNISCPECGGIMEDQGPLVDYYDDYSPYLSKDLTQLVDGVSHDKCVHLYKCINCNVDRRVEIDRVSI